MFVACWFVSVLFNLLVVFVFGLIVGVCGFGWKCCFGLW